MNFHCAVCNEPWDTRGIHYSNSDLNETAFFELVAGAGCPCCVANGVRFSLGRNYIPNAEFIDEWQLDVDKISEGFHAFFDGAPYQAQVEGLIQQGMSYSEAMEIVSGNANLPFTYAIINGGNYE